MPHPSEIGIELATIRTELAATTAAKKEAEAA